MPLRRMMTEIAAGGGASARKMGPLAIKAIHDRGIIEAAIFTRE